MNNSTPPIQNKVIIITGLSGAGISSTLNILQDFGFETIDNLPAHFLDNVVEARTSPIALAIDARNRNFDINDVQDKLFKLRQKVGDDLSIIYINCDENELMQRFNKTKRSHPMSKDIRLQDAITMERDLMRPLLRMADFTLDTTDQSIWQHQERLSNLNLHETTENMRIRLVSFSYGRGLPRDADLVFDVRFLQNPHYVPSLKNCNGMDAAVSQFVVEDPAYPAFFQSLSSLLDLTLRRYADEGKSYLTIAIGCTGGQHRSVAITEIIAEKLKHEQHTVQTFHREISKNDH